jgi:hypothetical protein
VISENCLFLGLGNFFESLAEKRVDWPVYMHPEDGNAEILSPGDFFLWVMEDEGQLFYSDGKKISRRIGDILGNKNFNFRVQELPIKEFFPVIVISEEEREDLVGGEEGGRDQSEEGVRGRLVGMRDKITGRWLDVELVERIARKTGLECG